MKVITRFIFLAFLFSLPFFSFCWGVLGHRITGGIAENYLTAKAKSEIQKILGHETIALASNWGDFIKSDSTYDSLYNWHFINLDSGLTRKQVQAYLDKDTATDVYTRTKFLIKQLKKQTAFN